MQPAEANSMQRAATQVAAELRRRIVGGEWPPGARLPPRRLLARELDSCLATVQAAVTRLTAEGFLRVGPRKHGTFVVQRPPHLCRYRLVFPVAPDAPGQFWRALRLAAEARTSPEREFAFFSGAAGQRGLADYQALVDEVRTARVAGLIFASSADELRGTPLLEQPGIPRVAIAGPDQLPGIPKVTQDLGSFFTRAVQCLHGEGRRRIALLCGNLSPASPTSPLGLFRSALAAAGLRSEARWEQVAPLHQPLAAAHVCELLFHRAQRERPDGLILADDNFLGGALEGLLASGIRVPRDLSVVAMTNFPNVLPAALPVTRLGFYIPGLLDLLVERLAQMHCGEAAPACTLVPAVLAGDCADLPLRKASWPARESLNPNCATLSNGDSR
jgi:hypothetical protein